MVVHKGVHAVVRRDLEGDQVVQLLLWEVNLVEVVKDAVWHHRAELVEAEVGRRVKRDLRKLRREVVRGMKVVHDGVPFSLRRAGQRREVEGDHRQVVLVLKQNLVKERVRRN